MSLQYDGFLDEDVNLVPAVQVHALVSDGQWNLSAEGDSTEIELMTEALFVGRLWKPGTEFAVYLDRRTNDLLGQLL